MRIKKNILLFVGYAAAFLLILIGFAILQIKTFYFTENASVYRLINKESTTSNSAMTYSIAFNNCYILLLKSPPTLENAKFVEGELSLRFFLMLYSFPSCYEA